MLVLRTYDLQILPIANLPQHVQNARSTRFLKRREDAGKTSDLIAEFHNKGN